MSHLYEEIIERIRGELVDLEQVIKRAEQGWSLGQEKPEEPNLYVDAVALNLHSFYSGMERLFELIARHVDQDLPAGEAWHRDLLQQMTQDRPKIRPGVIRQDNANILDEFRRFRHLVRHTYTTNLMPEKMIGLMEDLPELWPKLQAEMLAFADYLEALDEALD